MDYLVGLEVYTEPRKSVLCLVKDVPDNCGDLTRSNLTEEQDAIYERILDVAIAKLKDELYPGSCLGCFALVALAGLEDKVCWCSYADFSEGHPE